MPLDARKHFRREPRGKRRLHKKPGARESAACRPWLLADIDEIHPSVLLRLPPGADAEAEFARVVADLCRTTSVVGPA